MSSLSLVLQVRNTVGISSNNVRAYASVLWKLGRLSIAQDAISYDLATSLRREMSGWSFPIPLKFGMRLGSSTGEASAKLRNNMVILASNIACPKSDGKTSYNVLK